MPFDEAKADEVEPNAPKGPMLLKADDIKLVIPRIQRNMIILDRYL